MSEIYNCTSCKIGLNEIYCSDCDESDHDYNPLDIELYGNNINLDDRSFNCKDSSDSSELFQSKKCNQCNQCDFCIECDQCKECNYSYKCVNCKSCDYCRNCKDCEYCNHCSDCSNCTNMIFIRGINNYNFTKFYTRYNKLEKNIRWIIEKYVLELIITKGNDMKFIDSRISIDFIKNLEWCDCDGYFSFMVCMEDIVILLVEEYNFDPDLFPIEVIEYIKNNKSIKSARK